MVVAVAVEKEDVNGEEDWKVVVLVLKGHAQNGQAERVAQRWTFLAVSQKTLLVAAVGESVVGAVFAFVIAAEPFWWCPRVSGYTLHSLFPLLPPSLPLKEGFLFGGTSQA